MGKVDSLTNTNQRRPFFGYIVPFGETDPRYDIKCDAYGFEMNVDDEWPIDMILLTESQYVDVFSTETAVTAEGTVFVGSSLLQPNDDVKKLAKLGTHVMIDVQDESCVSNLQSSYDANLNVILKFASGGKMSAEVLSAIKPDQSIMVLEGAKLTPPNAQDICCRIRAVAPEFESMRIGVVASPVGDETVQYFSQPDVDGILDPNTDFGDVIDALTAVADSISDD